MPDGFWDISVEALYPNPEDRSAIFCQVSVLRITLGFSLVSFTSLARRFPMPMSC